MHDNLLAGDAVCHAYRMRGECITAEPIERPYGVPYDVRTYPQRVDAELATLRQEIATLRAVVVDLVETVDGLVMLAVQP